jgi:hypothetical protein
MPPAATPARGSLFVENEEFKKSLDVLCTLVASKFTAAKIPNIANLNATQAYASIRRDIAFAKPILSTKHRYIVDIASKRPSASRSDMEWCQQARGVEGSAFPVNNGLNGR